MERQRTSVLLEKETMLKLLAISRKTNKSKTFLISEVVTEYVNKNAPKKKIDIAGIADSKDPYFAGKDEEYLKDNGFGED